MNKDNNTFEQEYVSLKDVMDFQNNMFNPGHYIGTGRVPPTVSATGNATPLVILCFLATAIFVLLGLFLLFGDINVTSSGIVESPTTNKIIASVIMWAIAVGFLLLGFAYLKKAKKYHKVKKAMKNEPVDETVKDELWQRTCPKCGVSHDIDYPKCPNCKYNYLENRYNNRL